MQRPRIELELVFNCLVASAFHMLQHRCLPHNSGVCPADFHVIRNAGGRVDESALRSLVISQRLLGTKEIFVIHHTGAAPCST